MQDRVGVTPIEPEIVAVLVQDENLRRQFRREDPFPFGHDRLSGTDDSGDRVLLGGEFGVKALAGCGALIIRNAKYFAVKSLRDSGIAGDQIDREIIAVRFVETGDKIIEKTPGSAFD